MVAWSENGFDISANHENTREAVLPRFQEVVLNQCHQWDRHSQRLGLRLHATESLQVAN